MEHDPDFYVSPEDLEAQMKADERGETTEQALLEHLFISPSKT